MFLAEKTVKNYVPALFAKLGMESRTEGSGVRGQGSRRS
jgi:DNA-binding NarL/FixJ family response regulator